MTAYLREYEGTFRVYADYDLATNDFIRDQDGKLDSTFDDYYIKCDSNCKIRHFQKKQLFFYCPTIIKFRNILKQIYIDNIGSLDKFEKVVISDKGNERKTFDIEAMYQELIEKDILLYIEEYEFEGEFRFKVEQMDYISKVVAARKAGANISPFSKKNLPSKIYIIPSYDLNKYKEIINVLEKKELIILAHITKSFDDVIKAKKGSNYDLEAERKLSCLNGKDFIHSIGLFNEYLEFLNRKVLIYQNKKNNALNRI